MRLLTCANRTAHRVMIFVVGTAAGLVFHLARATVCAAEPVQSRPGWGSNGTIVFPKVAPPPQGRILALHFSRDGHFVLAQDHKGITILTVQPFSIVRRIPVEDARFAGFTPDSQEVVFISPPGGSADSHVEHWRSSDGNQVGYFKIATASCVTVGLSPDGKTLLCAYDDGTLRATDVASQETILERKKWGRELDIRAPDTGGHTKAAVRECSTSTSRLTAAM